MRCEDFPCCGHTDLDPCGPQAYDAPGYYDTTIPGNEHALCDHENGDCDVDYYDEDEDGDVDGSMEDWGDDPISQGMYDDDPSPYAGDYSEM